MKRFRTTTEFVDFITADHARRVKELNDISAVISRQDGPARASVLRAGFVMIYAHWEGFVRGSADAYLHFVASMATRQRLTRATLQPQMLSLWFWKAGIGNREASIVNFVEGTSPLFDLLDSELAMTLALPSKEEGIVGSAELRRICKIVGIDYAAFELREKFIDARLCAIRHRIAHGEWQAVDNSEFLDVLKETSTLLQTFKNEVENMAATSVFKRTAAA